MKFDITGHQGSDFEEINKKFLNENFLFRFCFGCNNVVQFGLVFDDSDVKMRINHNEV